MTQTVTTIPRHKRYKVNLPEQLADCEVNYQYLLSLLPDPQNLSEGDQFRYLLGSFAENESAINLNVVDQTKYTTLVHIVHYCQLQKMPSCVKCNSTPSEADCLTYAGDVRLYHDADMAEVVKCQKYRHFAPRYEYPNVNMHQVNEKAQMNRFLRDLLSYCLISGRVCDPVIDRLGF